MILPCLHRILCRHVDSRIQSFQISVLTFYPSGDSDSYSLTSLYARSSSRSNACASSSRHARRPDESLQYPPLHLLLDAEFRTVSADKSKRLAIIMADVDNFKRINDTYGHQAGDTILRKFAKVIQSKCRQSDIVAPTGGRNSS